MKKFCSIGVTLLVALMLAAPTFAAEETDFKVSGTLEFNGVFNQNQGLDTADKDDVEDYRQMQLRVNFEGKITEKITLHARLDALDKVLSTSDSDSSAFDTDSDDDDNIDFDRAWVDIVSPIGLFKIGRQEGGTWGTTHLDDDDDNDRIIYIVPLEMGEGKLYMVAIAEKELETKVSNQDNEEYFLSAVYVSEAFKTGILFGLYNYNSYQQEEGKDALVTADATAGTAAAAATQAGTDYATAYGTAYATAYSTYYVAAYTAAITAGASAAEAAVAAESTVTGAAAADPNVAVASMTYQSAIATGAGASDALTTAVMNYRPRGNGKAFLISPYFEGKIGPLGINFEYNYVNGELIFTDFPTLPTLDALGSHPKDNNPYWGKKDVKMSAFWLELYGEFGGSRVELGYSMMSGDEDGMMNDLEAIGLISPGADWGKLFILTGDDHGMNIGGAGNALNKRDALNVAGHQILYIGGSYAMNDNVSFGALIASAKTDADYGIYDDDLGTEIDLTLNLKFMDRITYKGVIAQLMAGDFFKAGGTGKVEDCLALYHELVISF